MNKDINETICECLERKFKCIYEEKGEAAYNELKDANFKEKICTEIINGIKDKEHYGEENLIDYILDKYSIILVKVHNHFENEQYNRVVENTNLNKSNNFEEKDNGTNNLISVIIALANLVWKIFKFIFAAIAYVAYFIISLIFGLSKKYK